LLIRLVGLATAVWKIKPLRCPPRNTLTLPKIACWTGFPILTPTSSVTIAASLLLASPVPLLLPVRPPRF
jgi:hypothetical protein